MTTEIVTPTGEFARVIQERRSIRKVANSPAIDKPRVERIMQLALHAPTAFNMQSGRLVVLMDDSHIQFWDIVLETLRPLVPAAKFPATQERLQGLKNGAGTVLFFEDQKTIQNWQEQVPLFKDQFPLWSEQGSAMLQYAVWLSFTADGLGASLQHYNPIIDDQVKQTWDIPQEWMLTAQMPFGVPDEHPEAPPHLPMDRLVVWH